MTAIGKGDWVEFIGPKVVNGATAIATIGSIYQGRLRSLDILHPRRMVRTISRFPSPLETPMTHTVNCRVASGPNLGGFPILAEFRVLPADYSTGDMWPGIEIIDFYTNDGLKLSPWFWDKLSDDQLLNLHDQCAAQV